MNEVRSGTWTVVRTKPRQERWAQRNVEAQGHQTYLPLLRPDKRHEIKIIRPLFPNYLFVFFDQSWYFLRSTFGVSHVIMNGEGPAVVPLSVMDELQARQESDGLIGLPDHRFQHNERVRVRRGPFANEIGLFQGMTGKDRVKVLFGTLGVTIADELLEAA